MITSICRISRDIQRGGLYLGVFERDADCRVRSLTMNPRDDTFVSAGDDATVRLWDLRMPECKVGRLDIGGG